MGFLLACSIIALIIGALIFVKIYMPQKTATVLLAVCSIIVFAAGVLTMFGSVLYSVNFEGILPRILFLAAFPAPIMFAYRLFRDRFGMDLNKFSARALLPPYIFSASICGVILVIGIFIGGWGGLGALAIAMTWHFATIGMIIASMIWLAIAHLFERLHSQGIKTALSLVLLILCGMALGGGLHRILLPTGLPIVSHTSSTPRIVVYITNALIKSAIMALPIGFGVAALMRYYRAEYSVRAPLFMLCAFFPTLLLSGVNTAKTYFNDTTYYLTRGEFTDALNTLIFTAVITVMTAVFGAVFSVVLRKKHY